jgi:putative hydrolase of the HAD superfamily
VVWLFDYDLTLYGRDEYEVLLRLDRNITRFLQERFNLSEAEADQRRQAYWKQYGTTLAGLRKQFGVSPAEYFDFIHAGEGLLFPRANPPLRAMLESLPGARWIFTNARRDWVERGLRSMGIEDCFDGILDIEGFDWICKPHAGIYPQVEQRVRAAPGDLVFLDDRHENLVPARVRGWRTVLVAPPPESPLEGCDLVLPRLLDLREKADPAWFDPR